MTEAPAFKTVKVERAEGTTFLILNRPDKRNAMSPELHFEMEKALDWVEDDEESKVVVITGAGSAFCAGQDIRLYFQALDDKPKERDRARFASHNWRWERLSTFPKPTIAMVNGQCFGGGFTQVCACDFAITADEAIYGLSEINWGIIPGGLVSWNMVQSLNYRDALFYSLTGDTFDGKEAAAMRLVNKSVPLAKLRDETLALSVRLQSKNPLALRYTKEALRAVKGMSAQQSLDYLDVKIDSLMKRDPEQGRVNAMKQFLDDKTYRPGFGEYKR